MNESHINRDFEGLAITYRPLTALKPNPNNPRTHSAKQIRQIVASMETFGFTNPLLVDFDDQVMAGHGRLEAAKRLGLETVPTIRLDHMSEAQKRAYVLADNKLAENAGWDRELLAIEFQYLSEIELDFDLTLTGFETAEIDLLLNSSDAADPLDAIPDFPEDEPAVTRPGDLWQIGSHRLLCGDATQGRAFRTLLERKKARLVFIDPPYNVPIDGHVSGLGKIKHREFAMASGEMSQAEFTAFLTAVFEQLAAHAMDGSMHYVCMDWRHLREVLTAADEIYSELKNLCVWNKTNAGMGSLYRSKHELVFVYKAGTGPHVNNVELGQHGRYRTNVWDYAGVNTFDPERREDLALHPTVKPVAMVADAIQDCSKRGEAVLDCFAGSGTTLVAAEQTGRHGVGMELDPGYVDVTVRRLQQTAGLDAVHVETGLSFEEVKIQRLEATPPDEESHDHATEVENHE